MVITKTPFRISFVGGGSDLAAFYLKNGGAVLSAAINKYMYISSHRYFEQHKICLKYSKTEIVDDIEKLQHPIVFEVLKQFKINGGLEISSIADIPTGTGLGSSSSFTVGMLHNMYARDRIFATKNILAEEACDIEINRLGEPIGKQDQYAAAYGGLNVIRFNMDGSVNIEPLFLKSENYKRLESNLLMFYIGHQRKTSEILHEQKQNIKQQDKEKVLLEMVALVDELKETLIKNDFLNMGKLLHDNWLLKKSLASKISNGMIDEIYETAINSGALGGKLLGAGSGGFMLFYSEPKNQPKLCHALRKLKQVDIKFDFEGSKVIYVGGEDE